MGGVKTVTFHLVYTPCVLKGNKEKMTLFIFVNRYIAKYTKYIPDNAYFSKNTTPIKSAVLCSRVLQTNTVTYQALDNQQVYI